MSDQLCTLTDVKDQLRIAAGVTTDDAYITSLIEDVSDWMQDFTRRYLCSHAAVTLRLDTSAGAVIPVRWGVRTVTSLGIASTNQPDTGGTYTTVTASLIMIRPPADQRPDGLPGNELVINGVTAPLSDAINGALLVADLGPATTPDRFVRVAIDAVVSAYQARRAGGSGVIGGDAFARTPWEQYFAAGSPQRLTLERARGLPGIA